VILIQERSSFSEGGGMKNDVRRGLATCHTDEMLEDGSNSKSGKGRHSKFE